MNSAESWAEWGHRVKPLSRIASFTRWFRDLGMILAIPVLLDIGFKLHEAQQKAFEAQVKANEAQIKAVEAQNGFLKETQYDRALSLIKSQKEVYELERKSLEDQISALKVAASNKETNERLSEASRRLNEVNGAINTLERCFSAKDVKFGGVCINGIAFPR
jgi:membrane-bound lytic murein transglycosylase B